VEQYTLDIDHLGAVVHDRLLCQEAGQSPAGGAPYGIRTRVRVSGGFLSGNVVMDAPAQASRVTRKLPEALYCVATRS